MGAQRIFSFVIRLVQDAHVEDKTLQPAWRGLIRHVQSNEERHFADFSEAVTFMQHCLDNWSITTAQGGKGDASQR